MESSFLAENARNNNLVVLCPFFELGAGEFQWVSTIMVDGAFCVLFRIWCIRISLGVHKFDSTDSVESIRWDRILTQFD